MMRKSFVETSPRHPSAASPHRGNRPIRRRVRLFLLHLLARAARSVARPVHSPTAVRRILVIKPDHLGDVLLATPVLRALRQRHPVAHIVALVGPWSEVMLARNPDINALLTLRFPGFDRQRTIVHGLSSLVQPYLLLLRYAALLRAGNFDTALLLRDDHWWGAALALLAGIPRRVGYAVPECRPFLTTALPWHPAEHVTVQGLNLVNALGNWQAQEPVPSANLHFAPAPTDTAWAAGWLARHGVEPHQRLVVMHPGTGGAAKLWLPERWVAVADVLGQLPDVRLLLTGGPGEETLVQTLAAHMRHPPLMLVGEASVRQLAALLARAALVLGVDSGPLHIAVSQDTPTIHLFGPSDAGRFGPWGDPARHVVLRAGLWCSPCGVFTVCPRHTDPPECMAAISVAEVVRVARGLLGAAD